MTSTINQKLAKERLKQKLETYRKYYWFSDKDEFLKTLEAAITGFDNSTKVKSS